MTTTTAPERPVTDRLPLTAGVAVFLVPAPRRGAPDHRAESFSFSAWSSLTPVQYAVSGQATLRPTAASSRKA